MAKDRMDWLEHEFRVSYCKIHAFLDLHMLLALEASRHGSHCNCLSLLEQCR